MIYGFGDEKIGLVSYVYGVGVDVSVVIDVGGFLGIGVKFVVVFVCQFDFMIDEYGEVYVVFSWIKDELKVMFEYYY